jgi:hypothetical protein
MKGERCMALLKFFHPTNTSPKKYHFTAFTHGQHSPDSD